MFKDIDLSKEVIADYHRAVSEKAADVDHDIEFFPVVLTTSHWPPTVTLAPTQTQVPLALPKEIVRYQSDFEQFYTAKHTGRKLTWDHADSHCVITGHFPHGRHDLVVSIDQALILLTFNAGPDIQSYTMIREKTKIPDDQLKHALNSLSKEKSRILKKRKKGPVYDHCLHCFLTS
jgi:hypothetical protein